MVRSEENMSLKNPVTPPGIDPGTVRLVAQRIPKDTSFVLYYINFSQDLLLVGGPGVA